MKQKKSFDDEGRLSAKNLLNAAQRKSLSIALKMIEERLFLFRLLWEQGTYSGILFRFQVDVSPQQRRAFDAISRRILKHLSDLKQRFGLSEVSEKLSDQIMSSSTYLWTVLEDEKAAKLKRYGSVDEALKRNLDPALQCIIDDLNELTGLITEAKT